MSNPRSPEIAALFALPTDLNPDAMPAFPRWASAKRNGVRAMWVPGVGLFSKDGVPYKDGILPLIEVSMQSTDRWFDGELYCHGMSLQQINARAGVNRVCSHPDHSSIKFHIFDMVKAEREFTQRMHVMNSINLPHIEIVQHKECGCSSSTLAAYRAYLADGYEGLCLRDPGEYASGRGTYIMRLKGWKDMDVDVLALGEGNGKYDGSLGSIICRWQGREFSVGSFAFDDDERLALWRQRPWPNRAKIKYLALSDKGIPYNTQCLELK